MSFVPLHKTTIAAVVRRISEEFSLPVKLSLRDELTDVLKEAQPVDRRGPFAAMFLDGFDILEGGDGGGMPGSIRGYPLARRGGGLRTYIREPAEKEDGDDGHGGQYDTMLKMNLVPVKYNFAFWYGTTDLLEMLDFQVAWTFARQKRRLDFSLNYLNMSIDVATRPSSSMTVARKTEDSDSGGYLVYEGQMETYGYANRDDSRDVVRRPVVVDVSLDVDIERALGRSRRMLADRQDSEGRVSESVGEAQDDLPAPRAAGVPLSNVKPPARAGSTERWGRNDLPEDVAYLGSLPAASGGLSDVQVLTAGSQAELDRHMSARGIAAVRLTADFGSYKEGEVLLREREGSGAGTVQVLTAMSQAELDGHAGAEGFSPVRLTADFGAYKEGEVLLETARS